VYGGIFKQRNGWQHITDASRPVRKAVAYESDVDEGVQRSDGVILIKYDLVVRLDTARLIYIKNKGGNKTIAGPSSRAV